MSNQSPNLNSQQLDVVQAPLANLLVIAGAGTGKTTTLIERIAYLITHYQLAPWNIVALTFTNKAANEIKERISQRFKGEDYNLGQLTLGTFHSICIRMMRENFSTLGLDRNFKVIDNSDQKSLITTLMKEMQVKPEDLYHTENYGDVVKLFNRIKDRLSSESIDEYIDQHSLKKILNLDTAALTTVHFNLIEVYNRYIKICKSRSLVDFSETHAAIKRLLTLHPNKAQAYQNRWRYILVDECQDTNQIQYQILNLLHGDNHFLMVGDDDQSIYGWRGAVVNNIYSYRDDFPDVLQYKLEYNYRSTTPILKLANNVIKANADRISKELEAHGAIDKTDAAKSIPQLFKFSNANDESEHLRDQIKKIIANGGSYNDIAVIYRNSSLSRNVEVVLSKANIPYQIYGSKKFLERAEVRAVLAYLSLSLNPHDNVSLERICNIPKRGLGDAFVKDLFQVAYYNDLTHWDSLKVILSQKMGATRKNGVLDLIELITNLYESSKKATLSEVLKNTLDIGIAQALSNKSEDIEQRKFNIEELIYSAEEFEEKNQLDDLDEDEYKLLKERTLALITPEHDLEQSMLKLKFLDNLALHDASQTTNANQPIEEAVRLMTIHASKGLEFKHVFLIGVDQGILPSALALMEGDDRLKEERRLLYVAITRAKASLQLMHSVFRTGAHSSYTLSQFIRNLDNYGLNLYNYNDRSISNSANSYHENWNSYKPQKHQHISSADLKDLAADLSLKDGDSVVNDQYGNGRIIQILDGGKSYVLFSGKLRIVDTDSLTLRT